MLLLQIIDYCNSLFYGMPDKVRNRLQKLQNIATRILTRNYKQCHITHIFKMLHWLPVKFRIRFKILVLTFQSYHGVALFI